MARKPLLTRYEPLRALVHYLVNENISTNAIYAAVTKVAVVDLDMLNLVLTEFSRPRTPQNKSALYLKEQRALIF